jgi:hypothetical protein
MYLKQKYKKASPLTDEAFTNDKTNSMKNQKQSYQNIWHSYFSLRA